MQVTPGKNYLKLHSFGAGGRRLRLSMLETQRVNVCVTELPAIIVL